MGLNSKENIFDTDEDVAFQEKYLEQLDACTPDLWDRIEQAVEDELPYSEPINMGNYKDKPEEKKKKFITFPHIAAMLISAAAVLVVAICTTLILGNRSTKSGGTGAEEGWWEKLVSGASEDADSDMVDKSAQDDGIYDTAEDEADAADFAEETAADDGDMDLSQDNVPENDMEDTETNGSNEDTTVDTAYSDTTEVPDTATPSTEADTQDTASENNQDVTSGKYIMVNGYMYTESGDSTTELPSGFDYAGAVSSTGNSTPSQNMQAQNIPTGAGVYTCSSNNYVIYIEVTGGTYEQYVID